MERVMSIVTGGTTGAVATSLTLVKVITTAAAIATIAYQQLEFPIKNMKNKEQRRYKNKNNNN